MGFREDFLWGGAVAAHQCEGAWHARTYGTYMNNLIMYVFMLVATLVCAYGLQWILYKLCPKVESVLLGGR